MDHFGVPPEVARALPGRYPGATRALPGHYPGVIRALPGRYPRDIRAISVQAVEQAAYTTGDLDTGKMEEHWAQGRIR